MKCFVCGSDTPGEVCNQCVRTERNLFHKEWQHKEGFIMKKVDSYRIDVTTYRITGEGMISNSDKGLNGRLDSFNHFVGNVVDVQRLPYNGKDAVVIHYKNPNTQMERFIFFLSFDAEAGLKNAIDTAKRGLPSSKPIVQSAMSAPVSASAPAPAPSADVSGKLAKLNVLLKSGILTQEEYENEKAKLGV